MKKVSIIIPIYNAEKNIKACIDSILIQTYNNLEIICVNDGSSDKSQDILEKYKSDDKRIKVINKKNTGVSDTRNIGIEKSSGDYIMFIDADDYIEKNYIESMISVVEKYNCEEVISGYTEINQEKKVTKTIYNNSKKVFDITYPKELSNVLLTHEYNPCWKQLISKKILDENSIKFDKNIKYGEDMLFSLECYTKSKKTMYIKNYGYNYLINDDGVMRKKDLKSLNKFYDDNKKTTEIILKKHNLNKEDKQKLYYKTLNTFNKISTKIIQSSENAKDAKKTILKARNRYNIIFNDYKIKKYGTTKEKVLLFMLKYKVIYIYVICKKMVIK